jgi:hypothetical protein
MTDHPQMTEASAPTGVSETIVARVEGTRPCLRCGHDLHGQSILREPEHGLFIARCPECGTVAALTEYPTLGVWGRRLGTALMATMIALLIPMALLSALALFGMSAILFDERIREVRPVLESMASDPLNGQITPEWWIANGAEARQRMLAALFRFDRQDLMLAVAMSPLPVLIGIVWSAILSGLPGRRVWLAGPLIGAIGILYIALGFINEAPLGVVTVWISDAAFQSMAWPGMATFLGIGTGLMTLGLLLGRTLFRLLASFALPPRSRRMVSFLWTIDGLDPPRGRG